MKITRNGQTVDCYGSIQGNNVFVQSEKVEDGWYEGEWDTWEEAVEEITAWAVEQGDTIYELQAD